MLAANNQQQQPTQRQNAQSSWNTFIPTPTQLSVYTQATWSSTSNQTQFTSSSPRHEVASPASSTSATPPLDTLRSKASSKSFAKPYRTSSPPQPKHRQAASSLVASRQYPSSPHCPNSTTNNQSAEPAYWPKTQLWKASSALTSARRSQKPLTCNIRG